MDSTFEQSLEADMHRLATEVSRAREKSESKDINTASEQAHIKEAIRAFPQLNNANQSTPDPAAGPSRGPLPAYADNASPEVKLEIEYLIDVALKQGISKALAQSQKSPYFVQDAFHDALAGKLYPELQKRGIVK